MHQEKRWLRLAVILVAFTIVYALAEGGIAIYSGLVAGSLTLEGFGLDSLIEIGASALVLWRLILQLGGAPDDRVEASEGHVHRFVGLTFLLLSAYIVWASLNALLRQEHPHASGLGLWVTGLSVVVMPLLAWAKWRVADKIQSAALKMEAKETVACSVLSFIALAGLMANALWGCWWADPVAGLCLLPWLIKEGLAGLRGEGCCG